MMKISKSLGTETMSTHIAILVRVKESFWSSSWTIYSPRAASMTLRKVILAHRVVPAKILDNDFPDSDLASSEESKLVANKTGHFDDDRVITLQRLRASQVKNVKKQTYLQ
jgi:hypothetical protein